MIPDFAYLYLQFKDVISIYFMIVNQTEYS